ncbi:MAG: T9SS type A sorting domain-containing protein [candidate division WOR-3 bacterium]
MVPFDLSVSLMFLAGDYIELLHIFKASELINIEEISKEEKTALKTKVSTITSNIFYATFSEPIKGKINLKIYDKNGRVLKSLDFNGTNKEIVVDLKKEKFSSDIYFFKLETAKNIVKGKFLFITK